MIATLLETLAPYWPALLPFVMALVVVLLAYGVRWLRGHHYEAAAELLEIVIDMAQDQGSFLDRLQKAEKSEKAHALLQQLVDKAKG